MYNVRLIPPTLKFSKHATSNVFTLKEHKPAEKPRVVFHYSKNA